MRGKVLVDRLATVQFSLTRAPRYSPMKPPIKPDVMKCGSNSGKRAIVMVLNWSIRVGRREPRVTALEWKQRLIDEREICFETSE